MTEAYLNHLRQQLAALEKTGRFKIERLLASPQGAHIAVASGGRVLNFCANNYLGLAGHPELMAAAHAALNRWGYGLASVRFICGTQQVHRELEEALSDFLGTEDSILYSSCFDANGGVFETLLEAEDAVISDALNHASIIDGIRLSKARRYRYRSGDLDDLARQLTDADAAGARHKLIVTDGVFSMDGTVAPLKGICELADRFGALVMVDDSHAVGVLGTGGRGTPEHCAVAARVDLFTGTFGKALGGASGGYVSGRGELVMLLRQRSRPYLFSNTLAPMIAGASLRALELVRQRPELREQLHANTRRFRTGLGQTGLNVKAGEHPIVPVMLGEADLAQRFAARMLDLGIYVIGFFHPVVPHGEARIRVQLSAAHTPEDVDAAVAAFAQAAHDLGVLP